jgi:hypothetical protein
MGVPFGRVFFQLPTPDDDDDAQGCRSSAATGVPPATCTPSMSTYWLYISLQNKNKPHDGGQLYISRFIKETIVFHSPNSQMQLGVEKFAMTLLFFCTSRP